MSNDDFFDIDSLRVVYDIDRYPEGADIFDYDAEAIRWHYPGLLPLLLFECYIFRHDTRFDIGEWECLVPFVEEFNGELSDVLSSLQPDEEYAARLLLGMDGAPVKPSSLNDYINDMNVNGCDFASMIRRKLLYPSRSKNMHFLLRAKNAEFLNELPDVTLFKYINLSYLNHYAPTISIGKYLKNFNLNYYEEEKLQQYLSLNGIYFKNVADYNLDDVFFDDKPWIMHILQKAQIKNLSELLQYSASELAYKGMSLISLGSIIRSLEHCGLQLREYGPEERKRIDEYYKNK